MPDDLTAEERAAIEDALRRIPERERRVAPGASSFSGYRWNPVSRQLELVNRSDGCWGAPSASLSAARAQTRARNLRIVARIEAGASMAQLVDEFDLGVSTIRRIAVDAGVTPPPNIAKKPVAELARVQAAAQLTAQIIDLADGRRTLPQIAETLKVSARTVRVRRDALNLDIPPGLSGPRRRSA